MTGENPDRSGKPSRLCSCEESVIWCISNRLVSHLKKGRYSLARERQSPDLTPPVPPLPPYHHAPKMGRWMHTPAWILAGRGSKRGLLAGAGWTGQCVDRNEKKQGGLLQPLEHSNTRTIKYSYSTKYEDAFSIIHLDLVLWLLTRM